MIGRVRLTLSLRRKLSLKSRVNNLMIIILLTFFVEEVKEEKKVEIDTKSYFAMFAAKKTSKEKPPVIQQTPKYDMEIEGVPNQENSTQNTASKATEETFVSHDKYQDKKEYAKIPPEEIKQVISVKRNSRNFVLIFTDTSREKANC